MRQRTGALQNASRHSRVVRERASVLDCGGPPPLLMPHRHHSGRFEKSRSRRAGQEVDIISQMNTSRPSQRLLTASYVLFFVVLGILLFLAVGISNSGGSFPDIRPFAALFLFAFICQLFVVYHYRKNLLVWILLGLYGLAALYIILSVLSMRDG